MSLNGVPAIVLHKWFVLDTKCHWMEYMIANEQQVTPTIRYLLRNSIDNDWHTIILSFMCTLRAQSSSKYSQIDSMRSKLYINQAITSWEMDYQHVYAFEVPPCSLSTCSTSNTGSRNPLLHFGQASIVTLPRVDCELFQWDFSTCSIRAPTVENLAGHWPHCSTRSLLLLLGVIPSLAFWTASLVATLSFCIPASADDLKLLHQEELLLLLFVRGSTFWLPHSMLDKAKVGSGFLGPGHLWSGPNLCLRQCSLLQSLHLIVFENVSASLHPGTGHFFFFVALW